MEGSGEIALSDMVDNWLMMINNAGNTIYNKDIKPIKIFGLLYKHGHIKLLWRQRHSTSQKNPFKLRFELQNLLTYKAKKCWQISTIPVNFSDERRWNLSEVMLSSVWGTSSSIKTKKNYQTNKTFQLIETTRTIKKRGQSKGQRRVRNILTYAFLGSHFLQRPQSQHRLFTGRNCGWEMVRHEYKNQTQHLKQTK